MQRTICSLILLPSSSIVRILLRTRSACPHILVTRARDSTHKSIPIVVIKDGVHESSQNRKSRHDLPTPVPTRQLFDCISKGVAMEPTRVANEQELDEATRAKCQRAARRD